MRNARESSAADEGDEVDEDEPSSWMRRVWRAGKERLSRRREMVVVSRKWRERDVRAGRKSFGGEGRKICSVPRSMNTAEWMWRDSRVGVTDRVWRREDRGMMVREEEGAEEWEWSRMRRR